MQWVDDVRGAHELFARPEEKPRVVSVEAMSEGERVDLGRDALALTS